MKTELTPAIMAEFEKIAQHGVGLAKSHTPSEDQSQSLFLAIMTPTNRYHEQFWKDPEPKRLWGILRTMVLDVMRGGTCEKDAVPGLTGKPDAISRQHGFKSRRCLVSEKNLRKINKEIEDKELMLSSANENLERLENLEKAKNTPGLPNGKRPYRHIRSPFASIKPTSTIKDTSAKRELEKKNTLDLIGRLNIQISELKQMAQKDRDVIAKFTSETPVFALNIIPEGDCVVQTSSGKHTMVSLSTDGPQLEDMLNKELRTAIERVVQGLYDRRPQYKSIYEWVIEDMSGYNAVYSTEGRLLKKSSYSRDDAAALLGIDVTSYITRKREVSRWLRAHKDDLLSLIEV